MKLLECYFQLSVFNPSTGDSGLSPIVIVLAILCALIILGCIVWALLLGRKDSKVKTTVVTVEDEPEVVQTVLEDIPSLHEQPDDANNSSTKQDDADSLTKE